MSVKKLGKAILRSYILGEVIGEVIYELENTTEQFTLGAYPNIKNELESLTPPQPLSFFSSLFVSSDKQDEYERKFKAYETKRRMLCKKQIDMVQRESASKPVLLYPRYFELMQKPEVYFIYKNNIYKFTKANYSDEEKLLLIMDLEDKERRKFEHLKYRFSEAENIEREKDRPAIPEEVRIAVWRRDDGKCTKCGSRENLEYDHIIPISKGGSNTVRNIELLCEKCNREKKDSIQ